LNIYTQKQRWKLLLLASALLIGLVSMWYTNNLVKVLQQEEKKRIELWAEALTLTSRMDVNAGDLTLTLDVIKSNTTIPVIRTNKNFEIIDYINLDTAKVNKDTSFLRREIEEMRLQHEPIKSIYAENECDYIFYKDSAILNKLRYYPLFQLGIIALFLMVSYLAFSTSRKAEQNQVWVGMAKETAHQLGTPLSSLAAWTDYLKNKYPDDENISEMDKDILRLSTITERFSKIGSAPALKRENLFLVIQNAVGYIKTRTSQKVNMQIKNLQNHDVFTPLNVPLFEWVLENIFKNAIDAMSGVGDITITIQDQHQFIYIDISDSGKGISKTKYKTVFKPGYTTKSRGWGLGLSLSKRIVEEYHGGQIFVKHSEQNKGTTFRIVLPK
jgi:hypothetical protein